MYPFDQTDLPRARRTIAAPIERVYATLDDVDAWPKWLSDVDFADSDPGGQLFEIVDRHDGEPVSRRMRVTARGPVHTLFFELDDGATGLYFRTRPQAGSTLAEVVVVPSEPHNWREKLGSRKRIRAAEDRLFSLLSDLATYVEARD